MTAPPIIGNTCQKRLAVAQAKQEEKRKELEAAADELTILLRGVLKALKNGHDHGGSSDDSIK